MIFWKLGFRNLLRNKRRSFLAISSVGVGLCALILIDGFMTGMSQNMVKTLTSSLMGQAQVHNKLFKENQDVEMTIANLDGLKQKLNTNKNIKSWTGRTVSLAMLSSPKDSQNILLYGIDPKKELNLTSLEKFLTTGSLPKSPQSISLGVKLKEDLNVDIGDKVVVTLSQVSSGELQQELFRIHGFLSFGSKEMDSSLAFISVSTGQRLLGVGQNFHEIVLDIGSIEDAGNENLSLWKELSRDGNLAEGWASLAPGISGAIRLSGKSTSIIILIMGILVGLSIINTLFMSIFERKFEFAVQRALGTRSREILTMIVAEATALGFLSAVFGLFLALCFGGYLAFRGVDYGGIEFSDVTFREPIYFIFRWTQWTVYPLGTILFTALVGLYPGLYAAQISMADAMKKTL